MLFASSDVQLKHFFRSSVSGCNKSRIEAENFSNAKIKFNKTIKKSITFKSYKKSYRTQLLPFFRNKSN